MRIFFIPAVLSCLAPAVSGQHSVNCWGKASHADYESLEKAVEVFEHVIQTQNDNLPVAMRAEPNSCRETWCEKNNGVRFCNEMGKDTKDPRIMSLQNILDSLKTIMHDCVDTYDGKKVAGGVINQPDNWSLVVQEDDLCHKENW